MTRSRLIPALALSLVAVFALGGATANAQRSKLPPDIPVTVTIADAANDWFLQVRSDLQGAYMRKVVNKVTQVESMLQSLPNGYDLMLRTFAYSRGKIVDSNRGVFFDLSEQTATGSFATPPLGVGTSGELLPYGMAVAQIKVSCSDTSISLLGLAAGETLVCPGSYRFRALDGLWYRLAFNPGNFPTVDPINVTCEMADSSGCKVWTVAPNGATLTGGDPNPKNNTTLLHIDEGGTVLAVGGTYNVSFSMTIAR